MHIVRHIRRALSDVHLMYHILSCFSTQGSQQGTCVQGHQCQEGQSCKLKQSSQAGSEATSLEAALQRKAKQTRMLRADLRLRVRVRVHNLRFQALPRALVSSKTTHTQASCISLRDHWYHIGCKIISYNLQHICPSWDWCEHI